MDPNRLKAIPVFAALDDQQLRTIATFAGETSVPEGKELVKEGDYAYELIAIEEGEANVVRDGKQVATLSQGDFFGEIGVLERTLRTATVVAATPMRLVTLTHWDLKRVGGALDQIRETLEERKAADALSES